jgi:uncharacterized membrane protein YtjA (UPF0391 family)
MMSLVLTSLAVSIVAALFGFVSLAVGSAGFAKLLFFVFLVFLGISVVAWFKTVRGEGHG